MGVGICKAGTKTCLPDGSAFGPCVGQVEPKATEDCATPEDDNCNGTANEAAAGCTCTPGSSAACYDGPQGTEGVGICVGGMKTCNAAGTAYGACTGEVVPAAADACNTNTDDNCNGTVNEGCPPTYTNDVQMILASHCAPCHTTGNSGNQGQPNGGKFALLYASSQLPVLAPFPAGCMGLTKGACALVRIQNGSMPPPSGCGGCVTAGEQQTIQAWITAGQPQ